MKIRALGPRELKQVLSLLARYSDREFEYSVLQNFRQLYIPLHQLSKLLPPPWQFVPAIYVAVTRHKVHGLIWLSQESRGSQRWKIEQLILDPDSFSYDIGTQLIHYVVNRYGAEGVQTFLALVDQESQQALSLFKSCGFRHCTRVHTFHLESLAGLNDQPDKATVEPLHHTRISTRLDSHRLQCLFNDNLVPEVRLSLEKSHKDFNRPFLRQLSDRMNGTFLKRWVVDDVARDTCLASVELMSENYTQFQLSILVHPGWSHLYTSALHFGLQQIRQHTANASITLECYEFDKDVMTTLEATGFRWQSSAEILVKDYWIPISEDKPKLTSPILLFKGKTSPA